MGWDTHDTYLMRHVWRMVCNHSDTRHSDALHERGGIQAQIHRESGHNAPILTKAHFKTEAHKEHFKTEAHKAHNCFFCFYVLMCLCLKNVLMSLFAEYPIFLYLCEKIEDYERTAVPRRNGILP